MEAYGNQQQVFLWVEGQKSTNFQEGVVADKIVVKQSPAKGARLGNMTQVLRWAALSLKSEPVAAGVCEAQVSCH